MDWEKLIVMHESEFGRGLFAREDIKKGTVLHQITGMEINFKETTQLKEESYALQVDFDKYILLQPPVAFCNHSCDPNCFINNHLQFVALKHIKKDEELFWDYSTSMLERHWTMHCNCGAEECRRMITDFDLLPPKTQQHYLHLGIVFPYIIQFLQQDLKKTA
jgi:uncharacterized protein